MNRSEKKEVKRMIRLANSGIKGAVSDRLEVLVHLKMDLVRFYAGNIFQTINSLGEKD